MATVSGKDPDARNGDQADDDDNEIDGEDGHGLEICLLLEGKGSRWE